MSDATDLRARTWPVRPSVNWTISRPSRYASGRPTSTVRPSAGEADAIRDRPLADAAEAGDHRRGEHPPAQVVPRRLGRRRLGPVVPQHRVLHPHAAGGPTAKPPWLGPRRARTPVDRGARSRPRRHGPPLAPAHEAAAVGHGLGRERALETPRRHPHEASGAPHLHPDQGLRRRPRREDARPGPMAALRRSRDALYRVGKHRLTGAVACGVVCACMCVRARARGG